MGDSILSQFFDSSPPIAVPVNNQGGAIYINIKNDIVIDSCQFSSNSALKGASIYIDPDFDDYTQSSKITITNCHFQQNTPKSDEASSIYISPGSTKQLAINNCNFEEDNGGVYIINYTNNIDFVSNTFYNVNNGPSLYLTESSRKIKVNIVGCIFDSCKGIDNKCFYILIEAKLTFENCVLQNLVGTGVNSYFGTFDVRDQLPYNLINVSFINNTCDSLYGGGTGIKFIEFGSITFTDCKFINNSAKQNTTESRPSLNGNKYYNGDGGAIQLGYHCKIYDMDVVFSECLFKDNKAQRHGGAIAAQTYHGFSILDCTFENNIANYDFSSLSASLLYNNYFDLKSDGRGGAVYVNPAFSYDETDECKKTNVHSSTITITDCIFKYNNAYDGYALYLEGDDAETGYIIEYNEFQDNYNESNHKLDSTSIVGAVIATEICRFTKEQIEKDNQFKYSKEGLNVNSILCVDHSGNAPTQMFTQSEAFTLSKTLAPIESPESSYDSDISSVQETIATSYEDSNSDSTNEVIESGSSNEVIESASSNEAIESVSSNEITESGSSNDTDQSGSSNVDIESTSSNEIIESGSSNQAIESGSSNEIIESSSSNEVFESGSSNQAIESGSSNEIIESSSSNEVFESGPSNSVEESNDSSATVEDSTLSIPSEEPSDDLRSLCIAIQNGRNTTLDNRCDFSSEDDPDSLIYVIRSSFIDFKNESNGGAIYIINSGFLGKVVNFTHCTSNIGAGGAIYIKDQHSLNRNITLENLTFTSCSALYGGACYIYQNSEENNVLILDCIFIGNIATKPKPTDKSDQFYGGSSIFLSSRNANITRSKFVNGKGDGGSLKFHNKFDEEVPNNHQINSNILEENQNNIYVKDCSFDHDGESKSSIYYVNENGKTNIEITECNFKGKLSRGSHYVDGKIINMNSPKLHVHSCSFEYDDKNDAYLESNIIYGIKHLDENNSMKNALCICIFILVIAFTCFKLKKSKSLIMNESDMKDSSNKQIEDKFNDYEL